MISSGQFAPSWYVLEDRPDDRPGAAYEGDLEAVARVRDPVRRSQLLDCLVRGMTFEDAMVSDVVFTDAERIAMLLLEGVAIEEALRYTLDWPSSPQDARAGRTPKAVKGLAADASRIAARAIARGISRCTEMDEGEWAEIVAGAAT
jgi:hypothetical protein